MKKYTQNFWVGLTSKIGLAIGLGMLFSFPASAQQFQQVTNALTHPDQNDFFEQGQAKFAREIQLLQQRKYLQPKTILQISPELKPIQEQLAPLEKIPSGLLKK